METLFWLTRDRSPHSIIPTNCMAHRHAPALPGCWHALPGISQSDTSINTDVKDLWSVELCERNGNISFEDTLLCDKHITPHPTLNGISQRAWGQAWRWAEIRPYIGWVTSSMIWLRLYFSVTSNLFLRF